MKTYIVFIFMVLLFAISNSRAESIRCEAVFNTPSTKSNFEFQDIATQRNQFVRNLKEVLDRISKVDQPRKSQWVGILPRGTKSIPTKIDKIDEAIWKVSSHLQIEIGRIELQNAEGETLGINLFSSDLHSQISGNTIRSGLTKALAQAWAQNAFFDVKRVVISHTHPGQGTLIFSAGDKKAFVSMKQDLALLGLKNADLEAHLLASAFFSDFKKKGIVIPAKVHPVHDEIPASMNPEIAAQTWSNIETVGKGYQDGSFTLNQVMFEMPEMVRQLFKGYYRP